VAASAWRARVDAAVAADDDLRGYVADLELQADEPEDAYDDLDDFDDLEGVVPDGDAIAEAFEEYLRDQGT